MAGDDRRRGTDGQGGETDAPPDVPGASAEYRTVDGVDLHVVTAGDEDDPLVVLLHGFPDFWYGWRHQIPALVEAGFRVLVPDQRGYNRSDKPRGLANYAFERLASDVAELIATEGRESAHVVGHDWGGGVAWDLALRNPDAVDRLAVANSPHPAAFRTNLRSNPRQLLRSWYILAFQVPRVPEWLLGRDGASGLERLLVSSSRPGTFTEADLDRYREAWSRPGAVRAPVDWYRAAFRAGDPPARQTVTQPTLVVWGEDDEALLPSLARESVRRCPDGRLEMFPDASHWVHMEEPERVNDLLVEHLSGEEPS